MQSTIYTLYEGHYAYGVGALLNSLVNRGFKGTFAVAYRGSLPEWMHKVAKEGKSEFLLEDTRVKFIPLDPPMHLRFYKPFFALELMEQHIPDTQAIYYFDPDIVVKAQWKFFESWAENGVAVCLDNSFGFLPCDHPWRGEWRKLGEAMGAKEKRQLHYYYNGGFFGITRDNMDFLRIWRDLILTYGRSGGDIIGKKSTERSRAVVGDQDLMNAAAMFTDLPLSSIGPEGMDFTGGGYVMSHAVYGIKPWERRFTFDLLKTGNCPSLADKEFMKNIDSPIPVFPPFSSRIKKIDIKLAAMLGRLVGH
jgi:hypothetical protein